MKQLLIAAGEMTMLDKIHLTDIAENYIPFLRDRDTGRELRKKYKLEMEINYMLFIKKVKNGEIGWVVYLLDDEKINPTEQNIVKILFANKQVDTIAQDNNVIIWAVDHEYTEIVKLLLADKRVDPAAQNNWAIIWAAEYGKTDVVKLLLADERIQNRLSKKDISKYSNMK